MKIYFARHGETEWNLEGRKQGRLDSPLTQRGVEQALSLGDLLSNIRIGIIYSSPLERALTTALIIGEKKEVEPEVRKMLAEYDYGVWTGLTDEEIEQKYPGEIKRRDKNKFYYRVEGGESYRDCQQRGKRAIDGILKKDYSSVLIVSHEMIGRTMIGHLLDMAPDDMLRIKHPNNVVYAIDTVHQTAGHIDANRVFQSGIISR